LRYLNIFLLFALVISGVLFGVSNQQDATVYFFWYAAKTYPLYLVLFSTYFAGTLFAIIYGILSGGSAGDDERVLNKRINSLKERIGLSGSTQTRKSGSIDGQPGLF
jgi:hypothetical protein